MGEFENELNSLIQDLTGEQAKAILLTASQMDPDLILMAGTATLLNQAIALGAADTLLSDVGVR